MSRSDDTIAKDLHCRTFYKFMVKSRRGKWETRMYACRKDALMGAVRFYKDHFGKKARIVRVTQGSRRS